MYDFADWYRGGWYEVDNQILIPFFDKLPDNPGPLHRGWLARLTMRGHIHSTKWIVGQTEIEVLQALINTYDGEPCTKEATIRLRELGV